MGQKRLTSPVTQPLGMWSRALGVVGVWAVGLVAALIYQGRFQGNFSHLDPSPTPPLMLGPQAAYLSPGPFVFSEVGMTWESGAHAREACASARDPGCN